MGNNLEYKLLYLPFINKLYLNVQNQVIFFIHKTYTYLKQKKILVFTQIDG